MSPKGRPNYARPDGNSTAIVDGLRELGFDVDVMPIPNRYDIVVSGVRLGKSSSTFTVDTSVRVEIKRPGEKLNANEESYWEKQKNPGSLIRAESIDDVLEWFGRT